MASINFAKKAVLATTLVVAAASAQAVAEPPHTVLGPVSVGVPLSFGGLAPVGTFADIFKFVLPANGGSGYSAANFTLLPGTYNTLLSTLSLFSNPDNILFNSDDQLLSASSAPGGQALELNWGASSGGNMYLIVGGVANGAAGGIYTGAISASAVTPVPEPESYAMLLAGLGVMGAIAIRRNKRKQD